MHIEGINNIEPKIKNISFSQKGKIDIHLQDGRTIIVPLSLFPSIKKLNIKQRKKWGIIEDVGFTFENSDELYHIEQILGRYDDYKFNL